MVGINALYMLLVAFGNITDYGTNFDFVSHVLSMDTTNFGAPAGEGLDSDVMWRAIEADWVHHLAYIGVIIWESAAAIVLLCSLWAWLRASRTRSFDLARRLGTIGLAMILVLFMGGFIAIGGEWFQMWRSTSWNGLEPAFRNSVLAAFGIVLMHLPSPQWAAVADESAEGPLAR
jgi:predicted small integral membrane protein